MDTYRVTFYMEHGHKIQVFDVKEMNCEHSPAGKVVSYKMTLKKPESMPIFHVDLHRLIALTVEKC